MTQVTGFRFESHLSLRIIISIYYLSLSHEFKPIPCLRAGHTQVSVRTQRGAGRVLRWWWNLSRVTVDCTCRIIRKGPDRHWKVVETNIEKVTTRWSSVRLTMTCRSRANVVRACSLCFYFFSGLILPLEFKIKKSWYPPVSFILCIGASKGEGFRGPYPPFLRQLVFVIKLPCSYTSCSLKFACVLRRETSAT